MDEGGQGALLEVQDRADPGGGAGVLQEAVVRHPLVVEDLAEVAAAAVGEQHHDDVVGPEALRDLQGPDDRHAAGAADEQALLLGEAAGHLEGVLVGHGDDLVGHVPVVGARPEVLADALDQVRTAGAAGVDRALRVRADHLDRAVADLLEVASGAADRAAGADARDEVGDLPLRLLPQFGTGGLVVRARVVRVGVLVRLPGARRLGDQPVGDVVVRVRVLGVDGGRADDDLGSVCAQHVDLVRGHLVRADEDALVALLLGDDGEPDARVPTGRLDDRAAGLQLPALLGRLDHAQRDAVLHRPAGVEVLDLGQDGRLDTCRDVAQPHQRGVADKTDHRIVELHRVLRDLRDGPAQSMRTGRTVRTGRSTPSPGRGK